MLLDYRKDIDGLRAVAVLLVVLFHMGFPISGGFVGVDIFFVISGFLIASLIQKQILREKFTFKGFYLHRMRRILPALIFVILVTILASWSLLLPYDFNFFISSIIYSLVGFSNIYFYNKGQDYFSADSDNITLLHTWSLGVEEQFYFIAPIFLILLFKFAYKTKWFNIILGTFTVLGFAISHYYAVNNPSGAYYLLPARFFELLMGVVLALNYTKLPVSNKNSINNILAVLATLLIFIPAFFITKQDIFPSYNAFFVCLGACLVIYLGKTENKTFLTKVLSLKPIVFIGLISYSLYLWHWPFVSMINVVGLEFNTFEKLGIVLIFIVLSVISWKFVEQPFRHKFKWSFLVTFLVLFLTPVLLAQTLKDYSRTSKGLMEQRFDPVDAKIIYTSQINAAKKRELCFKQYKNKECYIGDLKSDKDVGLLFGDSHANSFSPMLEILLKDANLKARVIADSSTLYMEGIDISKLGGKAITNQEASDLIKITEEALESGKYKFAIMSGNYLSYYGRFDKEEFHKTIENTVKLALENHIEFYIVKDNVQIDRKDVSCPVYNRLLNLSKDCSVSIEEVNKQMKNQMDLFNEIEVKYPAVKFINPRDILCDDNRCYLSDGKDTAFYLDSNHISYYGSKYIGEQYLEKIGNPFKQ